MSNPDPKSVIIDGATTPLDHVTISEAMSVISQIAAKLAPADTMTLAEGVMRLAATVAGSPVDWYDLLRREVVRADAALLREGDTPAARAAALAYIVANATPLVDNRTPAEQEADDRIAAEHNRIAAANGLISVWSVTEADDLDAPHPYHGATSVMHETISGETDRGRVWGGDGGRWTALIAGPRWLDLWLAADAAIQQSGDTRHRYVERFDPDLDHPAELHLMAGS